MRKCFVALLLLMIVLPLPAHAGSYFGGSGGGGAVASVTGAGSVSCSPTTGAVVCTGSGGLPAGLTFVSPTFTIATGAANQLVGAGSTTTNPVTLSATGSDTDITIAMLPKGANPVLIGATVPITNIFNFGPTNPLLQTFQVQTTYTAPQSGAAPDFADYSSGLSAITFANPSADDSVGATTFLAGLFHSEIPAANSKLITELDGLSVSASHRGSGTISAIIGINAAAESVGSATGITQIVGVLSGTNLAGSSSVSNFVSFNAAPFLSGTAHATVLHGYAMESPVLSGGSSVDQMIGLNLPVIAGGTTDNIGINIDNVTGPGALAIVTHLGPIRLGDIVSFPTATPATTTSPALKGGGAGATLSVRTANDAADAPLSASTLKASALTSGRVPFASTGGLLIDDSKFSYVTSSTPQLIVGTPSATAPNPTFTQFFIGNDATTQAQFTIETRDTGGASFAVYGHRGSWGSPTASLTGDGLAYMEGFGADSNGVQSTAGTVEIDVDASVGASHVPGRFIVRTSSTTTNYVERLRIDSVGAATFTGHIQSSTTAPAVSNTSANSCGTTAATIVGTDNAGKVTVGATAGTSCTVTFTTAWTNAPACMVTNETTANLARATSTTTTVILAGTFVAGDKLAYICQGRI